MITTPIAASIYKFQCSKDKHYPNGVHHREFILSTKNGIRYPLIDSSNLLRGKDKGKIKLIITTEDYTLEHYRRKVKLKCISASKKIGHLTKFLPLGNDRYYGDIKGTKDKVLALLRNDLLFMIIIPDAKHDASLNEDFIDGKFDDLISGL